MSEKHCTAAFSLITCRCSSIRSYLNLRVEAYTVADDIILFCSAAVLQALPEQEREKYGYERDLLRILEELVAGVDRKVSADILFFILLL
jgi:hypothetical protein